MPFLFFKEEFDLCNYIVNYNQCSIIHKNCPFIFYCKKENTWKEIQGIKSCKQRKNKETPAGYCKVIQERNGYLYIDNNGFGIKVLNPFNDTPEFVRLFKLKNGKWRLKKYEG